MIESVLVVCTGNVCRSPIAQELFIKKFTQSCLNVKVTSAGIAALVGHAADIRAQDIATAQGLDLSKHRATQLSADIVFSSDLILVMSSEQKKQVENLFAGSCGRVHRLGHWGCYDIHDPWKRPDVVYEQVLVLIEQGVDEWSGRLWK